MRKLVVPKCDCSALKIHLNKKNKNYRGSCETEVTNGDFCKFCGHAVYWFNPNVSKQFRGSYVRSSTKMTRRKK